MRTRLRLLASLNLYIHKFVGGIIQTITNAAVPISKNAVVPETVPGHLVNVRSI
jgi:hypothetical protein